MKSSSRENKIILKGMASNVIDEAIVILKPNIKLRQNEYIEKNNKNFENFDSKIVIKEAEKTIENYINQIKKESKKNEIKQLKIRYNFLKVMNIVLICGVIILSVNIF